MEIIADLVLELLAKITRNNSKKSQTVVDILVACLSILAVNGYAIWKAVSCYRSGNLLATVLYSAILVVSVLLLAFIAIRCIIRKRKNKKE